MQLHLIMTAALLASRIQALPATNGPTGLDGAVSATSIEEPYKPENADLIATTAHQRNDDASSPVEKRDQHGKEESGDNAEGQDDNGDDSGDGDDGNDDDDGLDILVDGIDHLPDDLYFSDDSDKKHAWLKEHGYERGMHKWLVDHDLPDSEFFGPETSTSTSPSTSTSTSTAVEQRRRSISGGGGGSDITRVTTSQYRRRGAALTKRQRLTSGPAFNMCMMALIQGVIFFGLAALKIHYLRRIIREVKGVRVFLTIVKREFDIWRENKRRIREGDKALKKALKRQRDGEKKPKHSNREVAKSLLGSKLTKQVLVFLGWAMSGFGGAGAFEVWCVPYLNLDKVFPNYWGDYTV